jgi:hypothetical protein
MISMRSKNLVIFAIAFSFCCAGELQAGEKSTHHAYRVTSYNLGAILDFHKKNSAFESNNFKPLMITSSTADILNNELHPTVSWVETIPHTTSSKGIAVSAEYEASENFLVTGAFGMTRNLWAPESIDYENEASWEANLGFVYKLVDNLSYELHFGYMDTGTLFTDQSSYSDVESIIMVSNRITMSF